MRTPRLDKTLADYVAIAISPALIMALVGSLVFFLLEVFYQGNYEGRLQWILALFVMATVLIGRISIEEDTERAAAFALPLAIVTALAIFRFVDCGGLKWIVNLGLLGLIWWCAHKLTWDCTLIDETEDASGEGLLQVVGLDEVKPGGDSPEPEENEEPEGVTSPDVQPSTWWQRLFDRGRSPHAPGVWIVYFSLAALPIFGIGQLFIAKGDLASRRYVFSLLCVYVASGLGLLLTTSFLGLRRYLRQRRLQMPVPMAGAWIAFGCALIVALLMFAALLPRPNSEYAVSELPFGIGSPDRKASRFAVGDEGTDDEDRGSPTGTKMRQRESKSKEEQQTADGRENGRPDERQSGGRSGRSGTRKGGSQGADDQTGGQQSGKQSGEGRSQDGGRSGQSGHQKGGSQKGGSQQKQGQTGQQKSGKQSAQERSQGEDRQDTNGSRDDASEDDSRDNEEDSRTDSDRRSEGGAKGDSRDERKSSRSRSDEKAGDSESEAEQKEEGTAGQRRRPSFLRRLLPTSLGGWLTTLFRWVFYGALIVVVAVWLWRSWDKVLAALRQFLAEWRAFWERLFGSKKEKGEQPAQTEEGSSGPLLRPFAAFVDPFAAGTAAGYSPDELVHYSFEALEAWAREQGWPRGPEQTPHEFARLLGSRAGSLSRDTRRLADLYCWVAYAPGTLPQGRADSLRHLWHQMQSG